MRVECRGCFIAFEGAYQTRKHPQNAMSHFEPASPRGVSARVLIVCEVVAEIAESEEGLEESTVAAALVKLALSPLNQQRVLKGLKKAKTIPKKTVQHYKAEVEHEL